MPLTALHRFGPEDMNPGEFVIYRAHLSLPAFILRSKAGVFVFSLGILIFVLAFWYRSTLGFLSEASITLGITVFALIPLIYGAYLFGVKFIDFLYDEDVITNQRVIDYNQKFLFSRDLATANMKSVENVNLIQAGVLRTLFDYGTLEVQTASSSRSRGGGTTSGLGRFLLLEDVKYPGKVQRLIDEVATRVKEGIRFDREEMLIVCGLKQGNLDDYFVVKKTRGWKSRVKKLLSWE